MRLTFYAICALGLFIGNFGCTTAGNQAVSTATPSAPSGPAVVTIDFADPGRFTDFRINNQDFPTFVNGLHSRRNQRTQTGDGQAISRSYT